VQSIVGLNVTVNFEHFGKQLINCAHVDLLVASEKTMTPPISS